MAYSESVSKGEHASELKERSGCITTYLFVVLAFAIISAITDFSYLGDDQYRVGAIIALVFDATVFVGVFALWDWKRRGLYILAGLYIIQLITRLAFIPTVFPIGGSVIGLGILYYLYHDKWDWLE